jgi:hypothetical protein
MTQMVAEDELSRVLDLLRETKPLSRISDTFKGRFNSSTLFRVGCTICVLVEDDLLTSAERLVSFYLLADSYSHNGSNPFVPFFLHNLERKNVNVVEKKFVSQLLMSLVSGSNSSLSKDVGKRTPAAILVEYERNNVNLPSTNDLEQIKKSYEERTFHVPGNRSMGIRPVISTGGLTPTQPLSPSDILLNERSASKLNNVEEEKKESITTSKRKFISSGLCLQSFEPPFVRPVPPMMLPFKEEIIWLNPIPDDTLMWDHTMCKDPSKSAKLRELMSKAFQGPLAPNEQKSVLSVLEESNKIVSFISSNFLLPTFLEF